MKWKTKNWLYVLVGLLVMALLLVPLRYYVCQFSGGRSNNAGDWASFATFWSVFISLDYFLVFAFLSVSVYRYTIRHDRESRAFQEGLVRPVLVFNRGEDGAWAIENVGNGPALKVLVGESNDTAWVGANVKLNTLAKEKLVSLDWLTAGSMICAVYEDIYKHQYLSIGVRNETIAAEIDSSLDEVEGLFTFNQEEMGKWIKRQAITIQEARVLAGVTLSSTMTVKTTMKPPGDGM